MIEGSNFLSGFQETLHDLDEFIYQKNRLLLVYAFIQIKKMSRKKHLYKRNLLNKQPNFGSQSEKYSRISKQSQASQNSKNENFSDIIQGVQNLNEIRQKIQTIDKPKIGYRANINSGKCKDQVRQTLSNHEHEYQKNSMKSFNSNKSPKICLQKNQIKLQQRNPQRHYTFQQNNVSALVPRLIGLTSQQQISDIEPFYQANKKVNAKQRNIVVDEQQDDQEFEDMILDRLSKIQQNVNRIIQQKKRKQVSRGIVGQPISSKSFQHNKIPGYMSGSITPNKSIHNRRVNNSSAVNIYQNYTSRENQNPYLMLGSRLKSNSINSPRASQGLDIGNPTMQQTTKRHRISNQKYFAQRLQKSKQKSGYRNINQSHSFYEQDVYNKSKKLGHYRESQNYINQGNNQPNKSKSSLNVSMNYQKIKQQGNNLDNFKYIPLTKINANSNSYQANQSNKTQRIYQKQPSNSHLNYERYERVQSEDDKQHNSNNSSNQIKYSRYSTKYNKNPIYNQQNKRRNLQQSNVKSYTQNADYVNQNQHNYSNKQISKKLKKLTQKFGHALQKQDNDNQKNGYRSYQTTQRIMYPVRSKQLQKSQNEADYQKQISASYKWRRAPEQGQKYVTTYSKNYYPTGIIQRNVTTQDGKLEGRRKYSSNSFSQSGSTNNQQRNIAYQRNSKNR